MRRTILAAAATALFAAVLAMPSAALAQGNPAHVLLRDGRPGGIAAETSTTLDPSQVANKGDVHDATVDGVIGIIEGSVAILMAGAALIILFLRRPGRRAAG